MGTNPKAVIVLETISAYKISMHRNDDSIGFLVHDVGRLMRARFDADARACGATRQQWRVLVTLARMREGPTQTELAERLDVEQITLCRMVDRLSEAGLVERRADPSDRRVRRVHLLPAAHGIVEQLAAVGSEIEAEALSVLPPATQRLLRDSLVRLREGLRGQCDNEREVA